MGKSKSASVARNVNTNKRAPAVPANVKKGKVEPVEVDLEEEEDESEHEMFDTSTDDEDEKAPATGLDLSKPKKSAKVRLVKLLNRMSKTVGKISVGLGELHQARTLANDAQENLIDLIAFADRLPDGWKPAKEGKGKKTFAAGDMVAVADARRGHYEDVGMEKEEMTDIRVVKMVAGSKVVAITSGGFKMVFPSHHLIKN